MQKLCSVRTSLLAPALVFMAAAASAASIKGTITDLATGKRLASMVAAAYTPAGVLKATATSDSNGNYTLNDVPAGQYRLLAYDLNHIYATTFSGDADSFETSTITNITGDLTGVNFALRKAGYISGSVLSAVGGQPLSTIIVAAYNVTSGTRRGITQTDGTGAYLLVLPPGKFRIAAFDYPRGSYATQFFQNQLAFATADTISVTAGQNVSGTNFRLSTAAHLTGTVVDADTSVPLGGKTVIAYLGDGTAVATTSTDSSGQFTLALAPDFAYKLVAADNARVYASGFLNDANSFANETPISPNDGQIITAIQVPMHRGATINGIVKSASGPPLAAMTVAAYNDDGSQRTFAQTDATGSYSLLVPAGSFRLAAYDPALTFAAQFFPGRVLFGDARPVSTSVGLPADAIDFSLQRGAQFHGAVTDRQTGAPVGGISVAAYDDAGNQMSSAVSDSTGNYALVVPAGTYRFAAFDNQLRYITQYGGGSPSYEDSTAYLVSGATSNILDFQIAQGVRVSGTVVDSSAAFDAVDGVQIGALDLEGDRLASTMTAGGRFDLVLAPGTYKLLATDSLHRFYASFYNNAWTLDSATPVVVGSSGAGAPITIFLVRDSRRRAASH